MRLSPRIASVIAAAAIYSASPVQAQFAAEDPVPDRYANPAAAGANEAYDEADPYAADPGYPVAVSQSIGDRTVADLASGVLGPKGARHVQDAEAIARTVIGKGGAAAAVSGASDADPVSLVRDLIAVTQKKKSPK
jgi:hypothetical protein